MANDTIRAELRGELTDAMKSGDSLRRDVIRQIETEISRAKADPGFSGAVDDQLYRQVIGGYVKRMSKARGEFVDAGERGAGHVARLTAEIDYLSRWLPRSAGEEETLVLVRRAIDEVTAAEPATPPAKLTGRVIGTVMRSGEGLDGSLVQELVRRELGA
jgi:uncharacterized protein YqeY